MLRAGRDAVTGGVSYAVQHPLRTLGHTALSPYYLLKGFVMGIKKTYGWLEKKYGRAGAIGILALSVGLHFVLPGIGGAVGGAAGNLMMAFPALPGSVGIGAVPGMAGGELIKAAKRVLKGREAEVQKSLEYLQANMTPEQIQQAVKEAQGQLQTLVQQQQTET